MTMSRRSNRWNKCQSFLALTSLTRNIMYNNSVAVLTIIVNGCDATEANADFDIVRK